MNMEAGWMRVAREDFEAGKASSAPSNYNARILYQQGWSKAQDCKMSLAKREEALKNDPEYVELLAQCEAFKAAKS